MRPLPTVLLAMALAGCGGGDGGGAGTREIAEKTPTKAQYLARGDAICADAQAELARLQPEIEEARAPGTSSAERIRLGAAIWRRQVAILDRFSARIKALGVPSGDEEQVREFVRALDEGSELGHQVQRHLEKGEEPPQALIQDYARVAYRGNALARAYGFKVCGSVDEER